MKPVFGLVTSLLLASHVHGQTCPAGFVGPTCKIQNIALGKPSYQPTTYSEGGNTYSSSLAVDGRTDTEFDRGKTCSTTLQATPAFWSVSLDPVREYNISRMTFYLRNSNGQRYRNMRVFVEDDLCKRVTVSSQGAGPPNPNPVNLVGCDTPLSGNNITIRVDDGILTLCEVQIWICADGSYGDQCERSCNCMERSDICDKRTGFCKTGCAKGFYRDGCQTACPNGYFGTCRPTQRCNCQNPREICNKITGACTSGCKIGTHPPDCQIPCHNNTYGQNCGMACGRCKDSSPCDPVTGACSGGCQPGWTGVKCDQECPDGTYGTCSQRCNCQNQAEVCNKVTGACQSGGCPNGKLPPDCQRDCPDGFFGDCSQRCVCRNPSEVCNKETGACIISGCRPGTQPPDCQTACANRTYGQNCGMTCGQCKDSAPCNAVTGECSGGCQSGWTETKCDQAASANATCTDNTYGQNCGMACGRCKDSSPCDPVTGACSGGCQPGWTGVKCDQECDEGMYGAGCTSTCGTCNGGSSCDKMNGTCSSGCQEGYNPPLCTGTDEPSTGTQQSSDNPTLMQALVGVVVVAAVAVIVVGVMTVVCLKRRNDARDDHMDRGASEYTDKPMYSMTEGGSYKPNDIWWQNPQWNARYPVLFRPTQAIAIHPYMGSDHHSSSMYD